VVVSVSSAETGQLRRANKDAEVSAAALVWFLHDQNDRAVARALEHVLCDLTLDGRVSASGSSFECWALNPAH
jgi:hypothetical protein